MTSKFHLPKYFRCVYYNFCHIIFLVCGQLIVYVNPSEAKNLFGLLYINNFGNSLPLRWLYLLKVFRGWKGDEGIPNKRKKSLPQDNVIRNQYWTFLYYKIIIIKALIIVLVNLFLSGIFTLRTKYYIYCYFFLDKNKLLSSGEDRKRNGLE